MNDEQKVNAMAEEFREWSRANYTADEQAFIAGAVDKGGRMLGMLEIAAAAWWTATQRRERDERLTKALEEIVEHTFVPMGCECPDWRACMTAIDTIARTALANEEKRT